ncbi:MAG: hypothetical protein H7145_24785 [Akkermansiaceae bacterium]|nr:hypothetical protein [Armatimonadota bacterium]
MNRATILWGTAVLLTAVQLGGCANSPGSTAGYNPPPPKTQAEINQEIDSNVKLTPQIKQMLKEQVANGVSSGISGQGGAKTLPPAAAAYLKSSRSGNNR